MRSAKKAAPPLARGRCYFLSSVTNGLFDTVAAALRNRFEVFNDTPSAVAFRWKQRLGNGPDFRLEPSDFAALKRQTGAIEYGNMRRDPRDFKSVVVLTFDDVDEVLDETNGLIEAQQVIQSIARGSTFNAWNKWGARE